MKPSNAPSPSRNTTSLLDVLGRLEKNLSEKRLSHKNIWSLLFEELAKFDIKGEVAVFLGEPKKPIFFSIESPKGIARAALGEEDIFQDVLREGNSIYIPEHDPAVQSHEGWVDNIFHTIRRKFQGAAPIIYSPLKSTGEFSGALAIRAEKLKPGDIPAIEALCNYLTLVWHTIKEDTIPFGLMEENQRFYQEFVEIDKVYKELFEHSNDAILIYDFDGNHLSVNQRSVDLLGYSEPELLSMTLFNLIPERYHPACESKLEKLRQGETTQLCERHFLA